MIASRKSKGSFSPSEREIKSLLLTRSNSSTVPWVAGRRIKGRWWIMTFALDKNPDGLNCYRLKLTGEPDAKISPEGTGNLQWLTKMILEWLLQSFLHLVQNVAAQSKKAQVFIIGRQTEKRIVKNVAKVHTANLELKQQMKTWWMERVPVLTNKRKGFRPFFGRF